LGSGGSAKAQTISGISQSSIGDGDSITISGSEFGTHSDNSPTESYLPAAWTDFESGYVDYDIWNRWGPGPEFISDRQRINSTNCARGGGDSKTYTNVFGDEIVNDIPRSLYHPNNANSQVLFMSGWFMFPMGAYYALTHQVAGQCKFISTRAAEGGNQYWNIAGWLGDPVLDIRMNFEDGRGAANPVELRMYGATGNAVLNENEWHRYDIAIDTTKGYGLKESRFYVDGKEYTTDYNRYFREDCDPCPRNFTGSFFIRYLVAGDWYQYFDDAYVDNTWARVEICNESIWNESIRKHCEIQIPIAWSDNSITITANQGSFQDGDTAYLFVVDENGTASIGYPITFTSAINDTTPPLRSSPSPTSNLSSGTTQAYINLTTDETANCRYSETSGIDYSSMIETFDNTDLTAHSELITGLSDGDSKTYYVRCQDESGNQNPDDFEISFSVASPPHTVYGLSNFIQLVADWLKSEPSALESDVNGDGIVNTRDLGIMMSNWQN